MKISILLVAEDPTKIAPFLSEASWEVTMTTTLKAALSALKAHSFQVIVTTLSLPDASGVETIRRFEQLETALPLIAIAKRPSEALTLEILHLGAQECLGEEDLHKLTLLIRYALERFHTVEALRELSFTDELTGLYNRRGFLTLVNQQMELSRRLKRGFFLFFMDLDDLKQINDTYGHPEGDKALQMAAACLRASFRSSDIPSRIGGDEFAVLALNVPKAKGEHLRTNFHETVKNYQKAHPLPFQISMSIGMAYYDPAEDPDLETMVLRADQDLYRSKSSK